MGVTRCIHGVEQSKQAESITASAFMLLFRAAEQSAYMRLLKEDGRAGLGARLPVSIQYTVQTSAKQNGNKKRTKAPLFWQWPTDWLRARLRALKQAVRTCIGPWH